MTERQKLNVWELIKIIEYDVVEMIDLLMAADRAGVARLYVVPASFGDFNDELEAGEIVKLCRDDEPIWQKGKVHSAADYFLSEDCSALEQLNKDKMYMVLFPSDSQAPERETAYPNIYVIEYRTVGSTDSGTYLVHANSKREAVVAITDIKSDHIIQDTYTVEDAMKYCSSEVKKYLKEEALPTENKAILIDYDV